MTSQRESSCPDQKQPNVEADGGSIKQGPMDEQNISKIHLAQTGLSAGPTAPKREDSVKATPSWDDTSETATNCEGTSDLRDEDSKLTETVEISDDKIDTATQVDSSLAESLSKKLDLSPAEAPTECDPADSDLGACAAAPCDDEDEEDVDEETKRAMHAELIASLETLQREVDRVEQNLNIDNQLNLIKERENRALDEIHMFFRGEIATIDAAQERVLEHYATKDQATDLHAWGETLDGLIADWQRIMEESRHRTSSARVVVTRNASTGTD